MLTTILIMLLSSAVAWGQPDIDDVITALDQLYRSDDSYAEMSMHIVTPHWERTLTMKAWSEGSDKTFISILSPAREAGMATLRIGTEMWNYLPNTNASDPRCVIDSEQENRALRPGAWCIGETACRHGPEYRLIYCRLQ